MLPRRVRSAPAGSGERRFDQPPIPVTYKLNDEIRLSGPFAAVGFGYRHVMGKSFDLSAGLELGAVFARTRDPWTAKAESGGRTVDAVPQPSSPSASSLAAFAMTSLAAQLKVGAFFAGMGLAAVVVVFDGPRYDTRSVQPVGNCPSPAPDPAPVECARGDSFVENERAYRRTVIWVPQLGAGWRF